MSDRWDVAQTPRVVFGSGAARDLPRLVSAERVLLVTTAGFTRRGLTRRIQDAFGPRLVGVMDRVDSNPDLDNISTEAVRLRSLSAEALVAVGGGSAIDAAKALSVALAAPEGWTLRSHFDEGAAFPKVPFLPIAAVATTAGTGAEVTPFGTLWDKRHRKKLSIAHANVLPALAVLDPDLTLDLPEDVTVSTGLDAISQGLESLWNLRSNPLSAAWALQSLRLSLPTLARLVQAPQDLRLRSDMLVASTLAGLAIAHTRTALAHSMSYPLTAHFGVPHGLACSFTLPAILTFTAEADDGRLAGAAQALGFRSIGALHEALVALLRALGMRERLAAYVPDLSEMMTVAHEMHLPERAGNLMRTADLDDIRRLLESSIAML